MAALNRTLDQELAALVRSASLECPVCGEFVMHVRDAIVCPECRCLLVTEAATGDVDAIRAAVTRSIGASTGLALGRLYSWYEDRSVDSG